VDEGWYNKGKAKATRAYLIRLCLTPKPPSPWQKGKAAIRQSQSNKGKATTKRQLGKKGRKLLQYCNNTTTTLQQKYNNTTTKKCCLTYDIRKTNTLTKYKQQTQLAPTYGAFI